MAYPHNLLLNAIVDSMPSHELIRKARLDQLPAVVLSVEGAPKPSINAIEFSVCTGRRLSTQYGALGT